MARGTFLPVFFLAAVLALSGAVSVPPPPENVRIVSENLGLELIWDPPVNTSHTLVTYTTEFKSWSDGFNPACVNQSETSCDVTSKISAFGRYQLRVRAAVHGLFSDWVKKDPFIVNEMTNISAPMVNLVSRKGDIEVMISDPIMTINDFQEMYRPVTYIITYWKDGRSDRRVKNVTQTHVILPAADLSTDGRYCIQVQISMPVFSKTSSISNHTCIDIAPDDKVPWWQIMLVMLGSFLTVALGLLLIFGVGWYSYQCLYYIHPKASLPEHFFKQHSFCQMEQTKGLPVELCDPVSIMEAPQPPLLEGGAHCSSHSQQLLQPQGMMGGGREN